MNITVTSEIIYEKVRAPERMIAEKMPLVSKDVYDRRLDKIVRKMKERNIKTLFLYADKEHCGNFEYVCGFDPRYEEAALIIGEDRRCAIILGNECFSLNRLSRIEAEPYLYQLFSLPCQPMEEETDLGHILRDAGITEGNLVGVCGWKLFPNVSGVNQYLEIPYYIIDEIQKIVGREHVINANDIFISPKDGERTVNEVEQIAVFEYASSLISNQMLECFDNLQCGMSEMEACRDLNGFGLPMTSHVMFCSGERADISLTSPTSRIIKKGDPVVFSMSLRGGLTCRAGYMVENENELPQNSRDYMEKVVKPYYAMVVTWLESIGLGVTGGSLYRIVEKIFPKERFGWVLNPGHLTGVEEWLSSPIFPDSELTLKSGMIIQQDIIPASGKDYFTTNIEDGLVLADDKLRQTIRQKYPDMWERMQNRREYIKEELGICLKPEVLPMSNSLGLLKPFILNKSMGMRKVSNLR